MTQHTISPVTLATCVEHSLHLSLDGFDLSRARLYGISIVDEEAAARNENGALRITFLAEHGDVYELLEAQTSAIVRMFDAAVVLTCGWAAPIRDDDEDNEESSVPPSQHPDRRRVRLVVVVGDCPELGNWDIAQAYALEYINDNTWFGEISFNQSAGKAVCYKYAIRRSGGPPTYENLVSRRWILSDRGTVKWRDTWAV